MWKLFVLNNFQNFYYTKLRDFTKTNLNLYFFQCGKKFHQNFSSYKIEKFYKNKLIIRPLFFSVWNSYLKIWFEEFFFRPFIWNLRSIHDSKQEFLSNISPMEVMESDPVLSPLIIVTIYSPFESSGREACHVYWRWVISRLSSRDTLSW